MYTSLSMTYNVLENVQIHLHHMKQTYDKHEKIIIIGGALAIINVGRGQNHEHNIYNVG